ncbi:MAG: HD domain-containing protein, partial [Acidobacteria bacterium]|nr:HD domain-containing protein [Acidobacteriota bacterium]
MSIVRVIERFGKGAKEANPELLVVFLIILLAGILNALLIRDVVFLSVYNVVVVIAAFLFGKDKGTLSAVLSVLVVILLVLFNPQLLRYTPEQELAYQVWVSLAAWAGLLLLTAALVGNLYERQERALQELRNTYYGILEILSTFTGRDRFTQHHSYRVSVYALKIGHHMGLDRESLDDLRAAALLHDIGKLDISRELLYKAARLSAEEFDQMRSHVGKGVRLMSPVAGSLRRVLPIILSHHEKYDGSGYDAVKGEDIPLGARILTVADVYDALTSDRPYR